MSFFEMAMLLCFGAAWPASIYKSFVSKSTGGKSIQFLFIILTGYAAGITHKALHNLDAVIGLYILNFLFVFTDIILFYRNKRLEKQKNLQTGSAVS
ncbi:MAG: hypothetical protein R6W96_02305 [Clostridia bacterium]